MAPLPWTASRELRRIPEGPWPFSASEEPSGEGNQSLHPSAVVCCRLADQPPRRSSDTAKIGCGPPELATALCHGLCWALGWPLPCGHPPCRKPDSAWPMAEVKRGGSHGDRCWDACLTERPSGTGQPDPNRRLPWTVTGNSDPTETGRGEGESRGERLSLPRSMNAACPRAGKASMGSGCTPSPEVCSRPPRNPAA